MKEYLTMQNLDLVSQIVEKARKGEDANHLAERLSAFRDISNYVDALERDSVEEFPTAPKHEPY